MEPQQNQYQIKTVLRHLQQTSPLFYLIPFKSKQQLTYPQKCLSDPQNVEQLSQMVSIDCEMVRTQVGQQLCRVVIVDENQKEVYNQWYLSSSPVTDYLTHVTGITQQILNLNAKTTYNQQHKQHIQSLIKDKIVIGHDLANDLKVLDIEHHAFIDTVHICPHHFGLPLKNKLKNLAMELLRKPIQWTNHDPKEDAITALEITKKHLAEGKGVAEQVQFVSKKPEDYKSVWQIIQDAQLQKDKIVGLFLRGSRALGLQMDQQQYKSDWDYFCVYDTWAKIDGRLIKLPQIDITIYDLQTFNHYLHQDNDIPNLELFALPQKHQIVNKLQCPTIDIQKLRESLGFHLMKAKMKIKRFRGDENKNWKILKAVHMKIRFMDYFMQIFDHGKIIDVKRMNYLWEEFKQFYQKSKNFEHSYAKCETIANESMQKVREKYKSLRKVHGLMGIQTVSKPTSKHIVCLHKSIANNPTQQILKIDSSQQIIFKPNPFHNKLHLIQQLRQNGFDNLDKYKILMKRAVLNPNLIQFKYMQSASFNNPICIQARGIILDESRHFEVVALPYYKFFDYNDQKYSQVKKFDFTDYKIYEKFDGSIAFIYHYANQWHVASSTVPDASSNYCFARKQTTTQFRKQFWRIFNQKNYQLPQKEDINKTFIFQLMSKNHIIVTNRAEDHLVLHGVRDRNTLEEEEHFSYGQKYNWRVANPIKMMLENPLNPIEEIVKITEKLDPLQQQGFILCDRKFTRLKVKSSNYLRINWLGELNLTKNKDPSKYILINIILAGQAENFAQYCPQWQPIIKQFCNKIQHLNNLILQQYEPLKNLDKKQFVAEVKKKNQKIQPFFFELRKNYDLYKSRLQTIMHPKKFYQFIIELDFNNL